jgi:hypothetical protein
VKTDRYFIVLPEQFRGPCKWGAHPLMRFGEQSRPAYQVIDRSTRSEVAKDLDYIGALQRAGALNRLDAARGMTTLDF